jgi:Helix-turn-helix domain
MVAEDGRSQFYLPCSPYGPLSGLATRKRTFVIFPRAHKNCWGTSFGSSSLVVCRRTLNLSRALAAAFLRLPCDTRLGPTESYWRYRSAAHLCSARLSEEVEERLKQREIAEVLGIAQPDVSHLTNGHFSRFTTDKLLDFLKRLNRKVTIKVSRHHKGEPYQQVTFAP